MSVYGYNAAETCTHSCVAISTRSWLMPPEVGAEPRPRKDMLASFGSREDGGVSRTRQQRVCCPESRWSLDKHRRAAGARHDPPAILGQKKFARDFRFRGDRVRDGPLQFLRSPTGLFICSEGPWTRRVSPWWKGHLRSQCIGVVSSTSRPRRSPRSASLLCLYHRSRARRPQQTRASPVLGYSSSDARMET